MKKLFSNLFLASLLFTACTKDLILNDNRIGHERGNDDNSSNNNVTVPVSVLTAFNSRYTNATNIEWKQLADGNFKAEFFRGSVKWQTTFSPSGTVVKEEHD